MRSALVLVGPERIGRWVTNFESRHGPARLQIAEGALAGLGEDGAEFTARLPFGRRYDGPADPTPFAEACSPPGLWGVLLVRKGGFAVARLTGHEILESKVGQRHVQGRTKAGGQSQQRFARRRDNQARAAYDAAADHAVRILGGPLQVLACGGDRAAVDHVLEHPRLAHLVPLRTEPWLAVPDPRRAVLERAVRDAGAVQVSVRDEPADGRT